MMAVISYNHVPFKFIIWYKHGHSFVSKTEKHHGISMFFPIPYYHLPYHDSEIFVHAYFCIRKLLKISSVWLNISSRLMLKQHFWFSYDSPLCFISFFFCCMLDHDGQTALLAFLYMTDRTCLTSSSQPNPKASQLLKIFLYMSAS